MNIKNLFVQGEQITLESYLNKKGIDNYRKYLKPPTTVLDDCYLYNNIHDAVNEIKYHILENHVFCIVIDGDFDGYSSAYIMYKYIKRQNPKCKVRMIIQDGKVRGLDSESIREQILNYKPDCLILPDSGTNSALYEDELYENNISLVISDHHEPDENVCKKAIVVNNQINQFECNTKLSGCGVTFKLLQALDKEFNTKYSNDFIDLVGISIISDSMDVRSYENRWFVKYILDDKEHVTNQFMYELFDTCLGDTYTQRDISFRIIPLINATIRCGCIKDKQQLFLAFDGKNIEDTIKMCQHYHSEQVNKVNKFIEHHQEEINNQADSNITIIDAKDIPQNFSGLIAGKISGMTNKPCIVGKSIKGELGGSFRGYININIMRTLPHVNDARGHDVGAYGIFLDTSKSQNLTDFRAEIDKMDISTEQEVIASYSANKLQMGLFDEFVGHNDLWGKELDTPTFYVYNIKVNSSDIKVLGTKQDTLKISLDDYELMFFKLSELKKEAFKLNDKVDLNIEVVGTLNINEWRGRKTNQIFVSDYEVKEVTNSFDDLM